MGQEPTISATYLMEQTARASAALPAAGAWDASPTELYCPRMDDVMLYLEYTRGAAGGAFDFQIEYSPFSVDRAGIQNWFSMSLYDPGVVAAGVDTQSQEQREFINYQSTGAALEAFIYGPVHLQGVVERIRIRARETANDQDPGTLKITTIFNNE